MTDGVKREPPLFLGRRIAEHERDEAVRSLVEGDGEDRRDRHGDDDEQGQERVRVLVHRWSQLRGSTGARRRSIGVAPGAPGWGNEEQGFVISRRGFVGRLSDYGGWDREFQSTVCARRSNAFR